MAGGDGSLAVVAAVAAAAGIPFVCVPAGTRNHFALDVGLDRHDVTGALDAFTGGVERRIDTAEVNGRMFLNNVSLGIYGDAVRSPGAWASADPEGRAAAGETVLVLGATGASGRIAVALAKQLGAGRVISAATWPYLDQLPAAATVTLGGADDAAALAEAAGPDGIHVMHRLPCGRPPTEAAIAAIHPPWPGACRAQDPAGGGRADGPAPHPIALPAEVLAQLLGWRSSAAARAPVSSPRSSPPSRR